MCLHIGRVCFQVCVCVCIYGGCDSRFVCMCLHLGKVCFEVCVPLERV